MTDAVTQFVYVIYIRTTVEKLWAALTDPEIMKSYWFGMHQESTFKVGAPWRLLFTDGRAADTGEILEAEPGRRLVIKWQNAFRPELTAEGPSRCTMEIEPADDAVKLTITHAIHRPESKLIGAVSNGWPRILSNLKSLLETGAVVLKAATPARA